MRFFQRLLDAIPDWAIRVGWCVFFAWLARDAYVDHRFAAFGIDMFFLGGNVLWLAVKPVISSIERSRDTWRDLFEQARKVVVSQHQTFVDMGPHLDVIKQHFEVKVAPTVPKEKAN